MFMLLSRLYLTSLPHSRRGCVSWVPVDQNYGCFLGQAATLGGDRRRRQTGRGWDGYYRDARRVLPGDQLGADLLQVRDGPGRRTRTGRNRHGDAGQHVVRPRGGEREHVAETGRRRVPRGQRRQVPPLLHRLQDRRVVQRGAAGRYPVYRSRRDQRRDEHGGDADPETVKTEAELPRVAVRRHHAPGRRHVVIAAAMLVVGDHQQRPGPARSGEQRLVHVVDQLLAQRHVVVGVLAVARRAPARLEKGVGRQGAGRRRGLEVGELAEVAGRRGADLGVRVLRERLGVVAVDGPAQPGRVQQAEDGRRAERVRLVVHVPLAGRRAGEGTVGHGLGRDRREPLVADRVAGSQRGQHGQRLRREAAHNVALDRARHDRPAAFLTLPAEGVGVVGDVALARRRLRGGGRTVVAAVQLIVGGHVAFAGVGAWHEIRAWRRRLDLEHGDGLAGRARVRLGPGQSVERLTGRRDVAGVQEPQHVIE